MSSSERENWTPPTSTPPDPFIQEGGTHADRVFLACVIGFIVLFGVLVESMIFLDWWTTR